MVRCGEAALAQLDHLLATVCPPSDTAAVIVEAIQADGGLLVPPPGFLPALAERCRRHGILLVCDEVKVGLGRTGLLHAQAEDQPGPGQLRQGAGRRPAALRRVSGPAAIPRPPHRLRDADPVRQPGVRAAGLAVLDTIAAEGLAPGMPRRWGRELADGLRRLAGRHEAIGDIRGRGLAVGVELVEDRDSWAPAGR